MKKKQLGLLIKVLLALVLGAAIFAACNNPPDPQPTEKALTSIAITAPPTKTAYIEGESFAAAGMVVTASYDDDTTAAVTNYTVSPSGALAVTHTAVTVSYTERGVTKTATQSITVSALIATVTSVTVSPSTATVSTGNTQAFTAEVLGTNNPSQTVTWTVEGFEDPGTEISSAGVLTVSVLETALSLTVRATSALDTAKSATASVSVVIPTVDSVTVSPTELLLAAGGTQTFTAVVTGTNNPSQAVEWTVSDNTSPDTQISAAGVLTIAAGETASTLTVMARSVIDATKTATATVNVAVAITSVADFDLIRSNLAGYFILANSIDMQGIAFDPIGAETNDANAFTGVLDGKGFVIQNMLINSTAEGKNGLFRQIGLSNATAAESEAGENGLVQNLAFVNSVVYGAPGHNGTVAGNNYGLIRDCFVQGAVTAAGGGPWQLGGIIAGEGSAALGFIKNSVSVGTAGNNVYPITSNFGKGINNFAIVDNMVIVDVLAVASNSGAFNQDASNHVFLARDAHTVNFDALTAEHWLIKQGFYPIFRNAYTAVESISIETGNGVTFNSQTGQYELTLNVGVSQSLVSEIAPQNASFTTVEWLSSNELAAIVDHTGRVTVLSAAAGTVTITVRALDNTDVTAQCVITLTDDQNPITAFEFARNTAFLTLNVDGANSESFSTLTLNYISDPEFHTDTVVWEVVGGGTSIITVDNFGVVTAHGTGTATVKAHVLSNPDLYDECIINVNDYDDYNADLNGFIRLSAAEDLDLIRLKLDGRYLLVNDIDIGGELAAIGANNDAGAFRGILDGGGYALKNYTINSSGRTGLFPRLGAEAGTNAAMAEAGTNGWVRNLNIIGASVTGEAVSGAIAGENRGLIENVYVEATVTATSPDWSNSGVIVGANEQDRGLVKTSISNGSVTSAASGGVVGWNARIYDTFVVGDLLDQQRISGSQPNTNAAIVNSHVFMLDDIATIDFSALPAMYWRGAELGVTELPVLGPYRYIEVEEVSLNKDNLVLDPGDIETLSATVLPFIAENKAVTWAIEDVADILNPDPTQLVGLGTQNVASVTQGGEITALSSGFALITVTTVSGELKAYATLTVTNNSISLSETALTFTMPFESDPGDMNPVTLIAEAEVLGVTVLSSVDAAAFSWASDNTDAATVANGVVTPIGEGSATITVTHIAANLSTTCTVEVVNPATEAAQARWLDLRGWLFNGTVGGTWNEDRTEYTGGTAQADFTLDGPVDAIETLPVAQGGLDLPFTGNRTAFNGTFDGGGFEIRNLSAAAARVNDRGGLFQTVANGAKFQNLNFTNAQFAVGGATGHGFLAGATAGTVTVENVKMSLTMTDQVTNGEYYGALFGRASGTTTLTVIDCDITVVSATVRQYVGAVYGWLLNNSVVNVDNSRFDVRYTAAAGAGKAGLIGGIEGGGRVTVNDSSVQYESAATADNNGGIVGRFSNNVNNVLTLNRVEVNAKFTANGNNQGGVVGGTNAGDAPQTITVTDCLITAEFAVGNTQTRRGGIIGNPRQHNRGNLILTISRSVVDISASHESSGARALMGTASSPTRDTNWTGGDASNRHRATVKVDDSIFVTPFAADTAAAAKAAIDSWVGTDNGQAGGTPIGDQIDEATVQYVESVAGGIAAITQPLAENFILAASPNEVWEWTTVLLFKGGPDISTWPAWMV
ncbi:MAG: Ig-like domain-containing protein [Firmicutes bacterium]|nr:Ig-like domain-containing protein [Bacillota bacterium]